MTFTLKPLSYSYDALEEVIDAETMEIHHTKHHKTYVDNLNKAVEGTKFASMEVKEILQHLDEVSEEKKDVVRNNAGGHYNHNLFWEIMTPGGSGEPVGELKKALEETFGDFESFKKEFEEKGAGRFGSGWVNLVIQDGKLSIVSTPNQDSPVSEGAEVIVSNDVWEHAYYLRYQNRRPEYLKNWWKVVNWDVALDRFLQFRDEV